MYTHKKEKNLSINWLKSWFVCLGQKVAKSLLVEDLAPRVCNGDPVLKGIARVVFQHSCLNLERLVRSCWWRNLKNFVSKSKITSWFRCKNIIWYSRKLEKTIQKSNPGAVGLRYEHGVYESHCDKAAKFIQPHH